MTTASYNPAPDALPDALEELPSKEERRALIERVAASEHFSRSARLRDFLLYVGKQSLMDGCPEIHEQEIGAKVFGRDASYDRSQDNIVRVNATELRKRIELYFASDGAHEPLIIEIPRGGYKPIFHRRRPEFHGPMESQPEALLGLPARSSLTVTPHSVPWKNASIHVMWGTFSLLLAIGIIVQFQQSHSLRTAAKPWNGKPAVAAFWGDFLHFNQQTDIVLPDDSISVIQDITHRPISLGDYLSDGYMRQIQSADVSSDRKADLYQIFNHNLITFGNVRAAQEIMAEIPSTHASYLTLSRHYTADAMRRNNIVLLGGKKSNPWDHVFDDRLNFITDYDDEHAQPFVKNLNPKSGEQAIYLGSQEANSILGYSVIAYLPNPSHTGSALILAGTDSDATTAAADFLTSEEKLEKFRSTLHSDHFPYFEVLLKTTRLSGASFNAELIAYRTYPDLH
jgi:hypothetical protein